MSRIQLTAKLVNSYLQQQPFGSGQCAGWQLIYLLVQRFAQPLNFRLAFNHFRHR